MWLINTHTKQLEEFAEAHVPEYFILSHRWGRCTEETSFEDWHSPTPAWQAPEEQWGPGIRKIVRFLEIASDQNIDYACADTCCINRKSSAELDESIRSMFRYYRQALKCIVYLADVGVSSTAHEFRNSEWFKRGWTLQELLAPQEINFYDKDWTLRGTLSNNLQNVCQATSIPEDVLRSDNIPSKLAQLSIARKMSWAANRETKKVEDQAYCLMGIFNVQMSVRYGEGKLAFVRLQKKILAHSPDPSIFAWREADTADNFARGLFAMSPLEFSESGHYVAQQLGQPGLLSEQWQFSPFGFIFRTMAVDIRRSVDETQPYLGQAYLLPLRCRHRARERNPAIMITFLGLKAVRVQPQHIYDAPSVSGQTTREVTLFEPFGRLDKTSQESWPEVADPIAVSNAFRTCFLS